MKVPLLLVLAFLPAVCLAQNSEKVLEQYSGLGLPLIASRLLMVRNLHRLSFMARYRAKP